MVNESAILYRYLRNTTVSHQVDRVRAPLEMAFFDENGEILSIVQTEVGATTRYSAGTRVQYRYILASRRGFMERNNISVDGGSRLLVESITK